jgi:uncharacterized protein (DUF697 family)
MDKVLSANPSLPASPAQRITEAVLDVLSRVPTTDIAASRTPSARARGIARKAARKAALTSGALALPPGPLGWLTVLPELAAVWRLQAQMVADIAGLYGRDITLDRQQMMYCLFRHTAAQAVRDLVVQAGSRLLMQQASVRAMQAAARRIGVGLTQRGIGSGIARWVPIVGAVGVGAYAYYDTAQVARTAIALFESDLRRLPPPIPSRVLSPPDLPAATSSRRE